MYACYRAVNPQLIQRFAHRLEHAAISGFVKRVPHMRLLQHVNGLVFVRVDARERELKPGDVFRVSHDVKTSLVQHVQQAIQRMLALDPVILRAEIAN